VVFVDGHFATGLGLGAALTQTTPLALGAEDGPVGAGDPDGDPLGAGDRPCCHVDDEVVGAEATLDRIVQRHRLDDRRVLVRRKGPTQLGRAIGRVRTSV